jgi:hypothetical protein
VPRASSGSRSLGVSFSAVIRAQALGEFSVPERDLSCLLIDLDLEAERVRFTSDFTAASFFRTALALFWFRRVRFLPAWDFAWGNWSSAPVRAIQIVCDFSYRGHDFGRSDFRS